jgi:two-component system sensor histidine kinase MprB
LTLAAGGAVFIALAIASLVIYFDVRSKLQDQVDASLVQATEKVVALRTASQYAPKIPAAKRHHLLFGKTSDGLFQVIPAVGAGPNRRRSAFGPLGVRDEAVARGLAAPYFTDVRLGGVPQRMYTMRLPSSRDGLVQTVRPLIETNATVANVRRLLIALTLGGALAAALLGRFAAGAVLRPVRSLAAAVRNVTATRDLNTRIRVSGRDEVGSLATDFNAMLAALDESQLAQQQLIADASHELRTPLAAHRANVELLARPDLPPELRERVLSAAVRGIEELSTLVADLIQAARDGRSVDAREPLALDELVSAGVERARHRAPDLRFESRLEPYRVVAARSRLERAVDNIFDNAIKWSPPGGVVDTQLAGGVLTVRDNGPGIAESDLPHVFDRFYRAAAARALPGSGLGLSIVKQTVDDHGGTVTAANADGGGAVLSLRFDPSNGRP